MSATMPRAVLVTCLLCSSYIWPSVSWALGLGEIHLNSALNEPMNAEIDLIAAAPDELSALRATLASREAFTRYGIDKPAFLSSLTFKVGKAKDGHDVLQVHTADAIPEPFVTFLVEVNWARGRLMREYTVLLDPPVYTPGETANGAAPVAAPTTVTAAAPHRAAPLAASEAAMSAAGNSPSRSAGSSTRSAAAMGSEASSVSVGRGDTLIKIARGLNPGASQANVDQTMIALYRANRDAFGGNINVLRQGTILRVPNADQIAAMNQREAIGEVHRQMDAWRGNETATAPTGHLRLVTPSSGGSVTGAGKAGVAGADDSPALRERVKDLEAQLADSKRLIDIRNGELSALQRKLSAVPPAAPPAMPAAPPVAAKAPPAPPAAPPVAVTPKPTPSEAAVPPPPVVPAPPPPVMTAPPAAAQPEPVPAPPAPPMNKPAAPAESGSWLDWVADNWWVPVALLVLAIGGLGFAAMRRRRSEDNAMNGLMDDTGVADGRDPTSKLAALRRGNESFVVEESGPHAQPDFAADAESVGDTSEMKSPEDTLSSESAVNLDQGDPLAEADFHMAYGLYDQAADLVRIALEREPERRDLRLKLLEIYFVWGNKDLFLQTAKGLEETRERAPAGEWDKILIMGKQICPDEPMFNAAAGSGRGAGALVDLNLEGGENRVDIDLFGDPEGERSSLDHAHAKDGTDRQPAIDSIGLGTDTGLDFTLDAPERGADDSPTRQMPPRDEPTVESELMNFGDSNFFDPVAEAPTTESPALSAEPPDRITSRLPVIDQTAEVAIDDLGLDLDDLEQTGSASHSLSALEETDHPTDAPTLVAGLDERSRRMMEDAERNARDRELAAHEHDLSATHRDMTATDRDLTELERELEASFVADLDPSHEDHKTAFLGPESAPTVLMPRELDSSPTTRFKTTEITDLDGPDRMDIDSTSRLRGLNADSVDLDLDHLASALGGNDTIEQPRAAEDLFSNDVFETSQHKVDLDVGEALVGSDSPTNKLQAQTNRLKPVDLGLPELEPVTMSEVGTKLDLARAYMDMGDPEGARSILAEVVQEGSASQKQEASRLIESLPG